MTTDERLDRLEAVQREMLETAPTTAHILNLHTHLRVISERIEKLEGYLKPTYVPESAVEDSIAQAERNRDVQTYTKHVDHLLKEVEELKETEKLLRGHLSDSSTANNQMYEESCESTEKIKELQARSARQAGEISKLTSEIERLESENAELRVLVNKENVMTQEQRAHKAVERFLKKHGRLPEPGEWQRLSIWERLSRAAQVVYCFLRGGPRLVQTLHDTQFWGWKKD